MISKQEFLDASILIVDDQIANVQLLEKMLHDSGYQNITTTTDPQVVCGLHRDNHYDLILLDLLMPGIDGFEVMQALKEIEAESYLPILVITAQPDHKLRALEAGAKDFICKPFDLVEVNTRIHNMLEVRLLYKQREHYNDLLEQTVLERTAELSKSRARFRRLAELSSDWYWEQDEHRHFTQIFGPVYEMLGIKVDDTAKSSRDESGAIWNEAERDLLEEKLASRLPFLDFVYRRFDVDGTEHYLMVSGEPMFNSSGRYTGYRGIGKDVTNSVHTRHLTHMGH